MELLIEYIDEHGVWISRLARDLRRNELKEKLADVRQHHDDRNADEFIGAVAKLLGELADVRERLREVLDVGDFGFVLRDYNDPPEPL